MGQSPSAELVYGVKLSEVDEEYTWLERPKDVDEEEWEDDTAACIEDLVKFDSWSLIESPPRFAVYRAGSWDFSQEFMGYGFGASDWTAEEISIGDLKVPEGADKRIQDALLKLDAPIEVLAKGASWWLLPFYG